MTDFTERGATTVTKTKGKGKGVQQKELSQLLAEVRQASSQSSRLQEDLQSMQLQGCLCGRQLPHPRQAPALQEEVEEARRHLWSS